MLPLPDLPHALQSHLAGAAWEDVTFGYSGMRVFRLTETRQPPCYLKLARGPLRCELRAERDALVWLKGHLPVPEVLVFAEDATNTYLLLSEVAGVMAYDAVFAEDIPALVRLLGVGLRQFHALDYSILYLTSHVSWCRDKLPAGATDR
jgi:aminoglycoside phosphotransferase